MSTPACHPAAERDLMSNVNNKIDLKKNSGSLTKVSFCQAVPHAVISLQQTIN
jgi:hypothetical protein